MRSENLSVIRYIHNNLITLRFSECKADNSLTLRKSECDQIHLIFSERAVLKPRGFRTGGSEARVPSEWAALQPRAFRTGGSEARLLKLLPKA